MTFGEKLLQLRKQNAMSQEELAEKLSVSRQSVSKWEPDESLPDTKNIVQLGKMFRVTMDYLLNDDIDAIQAAADISTKNQTAQIAQCKSKRSSTMLAGCILAFLGFCSLVLFWILSIVNPAIVYSSSGTYDRLQGYLIFHKAEWLFAFCCLVFAAGSVTIIYDLHKRQIASK